MANPIGKITLPTEAVQYGNLGSATGPIAFLNNILNLIIFLAGLFTLINFIMAAYGYLTSDGQPQKISAAGYKILQSVIGLAIVASTFIIATVLGYILYKDPTALIDFSLFSLSGIGSFQYFQLPPTQTVPIK